MHSLDSHGRRRINFAERATNHGTQHDGGDLQTFRAHINAKHCLAIDFAWSIGTRRWSADQFEVFGCLERYNVWHWQTNSCIDQFTIRQLTATGRMQNPATLGSATGGFHTPLNCRSVDQQNARGSPRFTQRLPITRHRGRATGHLEAQHGVGIALVVGGSVLDGDLVQIDL
ncbi:hypothetical protein D3C76_895050 [compost metagenome]